MRVGDCIWLARRINEPNAEHPKYEKPQKIYTRFGYITVQPSVSRHDMRVETHGETVYGDWSVVANSRYFGGKIKVGDLFWVDGESPIEAVETAYGYGSTATAEVVAVMPVNLTTNIVLRRNQKQIKR